ncbi:hypothetical protein E2C01_028021 [Portunus trituberculatus]|uniref:Uncharacterized protein n=1 Tax=Portunus trituberculatus TaxID=210409 RepID=A0A5B7EMI3_PORTR|nr:hypothetical protein [Portunus trituberculatus]
MFPRGVSNHTTMSVYILCSENLFWPLLMPAVMVPLLQVMPPQQQATTPSPEPSPSSSGSPSAPPLPSSSSRAAVAKERLMRFRTRFLRVVFFSQ